MMELIVKFYPVDARIVAAELADMVTERFREEQAEGINPVAEELHVDIEEGTHRAVLNLIEEGVTLDIEGDELCNIFMDIVEQGSELMDNVISEVTQ